tara:strand:+ start:1607 stop:2101 length:495 start_codon:yes stop_codon:yes gene_type:complete
MDTGEQQFRNACITGDVEALDALVENGFQVTIERYETASKHMDRRKAFQDRLFWSVMQSHNLTPESCAELGFIDALTQLHRIGQPMTIDVAKRAIEHGHVECLKYAVNNLDDRDGCHGSGVFFSAQAALDEHKKHLPDGAAKQISDALMEGYWNAVANERSICN